MSRNFYIINTISKNFKKIFGKNVVNYINSVRIANAVRILEESHVSIHPELFLRGCKAIPETYLSAAVPGILCKVSLFNIKADGTNIKLDLEHNSIPCGRIQRKKKISFLSSEDIKTVLVRESEGAD